MLEIEQQLTKIYFLIKEENKNRIMEKLREIIEFEAAMLDKTERSEEECLGKLK